MPAGDLKEPNELIMILRYIEIDFGKKLLMK